MPALIPCRQSMKLLYWICPLHAYCLPLCFATLQEQQGVAHSIRRIAVGAPMHAAADTALQPSQGSVLDNRIIAIMWTILCTAAGSLSTHEAHWCKP